MKHRVRRDRGSGLAGVKALALGGALAFAVLSPIESFSVVRNPATSAGPASNASLGETACERIGREALTRTLRGVSGSRSGDIILIPEPPNFVNGGLTHATPFDYTQEVPLLLYGPGYVTPGVYTEPVTLADIAPTQAALLKFPFEAPDGQAQVDALAAEDERPVPALVVTVVWDSVGDNVLQRWPDAWPTL